MGMAGGAGKEGVVSDCNESLKALKTEKVRISLKVLEALQTGADLGL